MARRDRGSNRRRVGWNQFVGGSFAQTGNGTIVGPGLSPVTGVQAFTLVRIRGEVLVHLEGTLAADDNVRLAIGLGVFSTDAFTLGDTAMPDPLDDASFSWIWYWSGHLLMPGAATSATWDQATTGTAAVRMPIDTKGMRKIKNGETLGFVMQYADQTGTPPVGWDFGATRALFKLA